MAASTFVTALARTWTSIATGPLTDCLVTPSQAGFYLYAASQPTADLGHSIDQFENVNAVTEAGQQFWYLSPFEDATVVKTQVA